MTDRSAVESSSSSDESQELSGSLLMPSEPLAPEDDKEEVTESRAKSAIGNILELILLVIIAFALAWLVKTFVVQPFFIPSESMEPTLLIEDHVLVNKFIYRFVDPERGDVMVFKYPVDPSKDYIKRLIGLPGDTIRVKSGFVYVNGKKLDEPYVMRPRDISDYPGDGRSVKVPEGRYFMMGDNRANSADSRVWGFLPEENIVGRAFVIYYPFQRVGGVKG